MCEFASKEPFLAVTKAQIVLCYVKDVEATDVGNHYKEKEILILFN